MVDQDHKHKKEKKHKKHKKEKKQKGDELKATATQAYWGKYGIIKAEDMHEKQEEFYGWLMEVRAASPRWYPSRPAPRLKVLSAPHVFPHVFSH